MHRCHGGQPICVGLSFPGCVADVWCLGGGPSFRGALGHRPVTALHELPEFSRSRVCFPFGVCATAKRVHCPARDEGRTHAGCP